MIYKRFLSVVCVSSFLIFFYFFVFILVLALMILTILFFNIHFFCFSSRTLVRVSWTYIPELDWFETFYGLYGRKVREQTLDLNIVLIPSRVTILLNYLQIIFYLFSFFFIVSHFYLLIFVSDFFLSFIICIFHCYVS